MRTALAVACCAGMSSLVTTAQAADPWQALRRPLELPSIAAGAPCPVSPVDRRVDWDSVNAFGVGTGRGPVYPSAGDDGQVVYRTQADTAPWLRGKVFWYVKPSYRGRVLIRGGRIDAAGSLRFDAGERMARELRIRPGDSVQWSGRPAGSRGIPSITRVVAPGCFAVQIDGTSFSRTVVFTAAAA